MRLSSCSACAIKQYYFQEACCLHPHSLTLGCSPHQTRGRSFEDTRPTPTPRFPHTFQPPLTLTNSMVTATATYSSDNSVDTLYSEITNPKKKKKLVHRTRYINIFQIAYNPNNIYNTQRDQLLLTLKNAIIVSRDQHHSADEMLFRKPGALRSSTCAYSMQWSPRQPKPSKAGVGPPLCGCPCKTSSTVWLVNLLPSAPDEYTHTHENNGRIIIKRATTKTGRWG